MPLDIGLGILSAIYISHTFGTPLAITVWFGILFSLLMDIDAILYVLKRGNAGLIHNHRNILHYPLLYIPIGALLLIPFGIPWLLLFVINSLFHFIHDSIGIGWGVKWLYPFSKNSYSFLYVYKPVAKKVFLPQQILYVFKPEQIQSLAETHGDKNWIKHIYFSFHPYGMIEYIVFILSIISLLMYVN